MIPSGKGRRFDQGNFGDFANDNAGPLYNASTSPVNVISLAGTSRGLKTGWFEGPTLAIDWHGFILCNQNQWEPFFNDRKCSVDVGIGAVGSEILLVQDFCFDQPSHMRSSQQSFIPLFLPAGTTMHFRVMVYADTTSGTWNERPMALGFNQPITHHKVFSRSETLGIANVAAPVEGNGYGTLLDPTVSNTYTAWTSIGTTGFDWHAFHIQLGQGFNGIDPDVNRASGPYQQNYQIGFGAGPDVIIDVGYIYLDDSAAGSGDWHGGGHMHLEPYYMYVPAGTQIQARMQSDIVADVGARSKDVRVIGYG